MLFYYVIQKQGSCGIFCKGAFMIHHDSVLFQKVAGKRFQTGSLYQRPLTQSWGTSGVSSFLTTSCLTFFKVCFIGYAIIVVPIFLPFPLPPSTPLPSSNPPPQSMSMGPAYKFFGFSISCIILSIPLFCIYQLCFLIPVPFSPFSSFPLPADNPPCDLHIYDSIPVLVICLVFGFFRFSC